MKPAPWKPSVELSPRETRLLKVTKQKTFYGFLRKHRHELFDDAFQAELAEMYTDVPGNAPTSPALLATVTLLQATSRCASRSILRRCSRPAGSKTLSTYSATPLARFWPPPRPSSDGPPRS